MDCPISFRRLMHVFETLNGPNIARRHAAAPPCKSLVKSYESIIMSSFGYIGYEYSDLPVSRLKIILQRFHLDESSLRIAESLFDHHGYKHSALCLLDDIELIVQAVLHFGMEEGRLKLPLQWYRMFDKEDQRILKCFSDHLARVAKFSEQRNCTSPQATPELFEQEMIQPPISLFKLVKNMHSYERE